jgi:hypothetical protein
MRCLVLKIRWIRFLTSDCDIADLECFDVCNALTGLAWWGGVTQGGAALCPGLGCNALSGLSGCSVIHKHQFISNLAQTASVDTHRKSNMDLQDDGRSNLQFGEINEKVNQSTN